MVEHRSPEINPEPPERLSLGLVDRHSVGQLDWELLSMDGEVVALIVGHCNAWDEDG